RDNMPGSKREVKNAIDEGVEFVWLSSPKAVLAKGSGRGKVKAIRAAAMRLGLADSSGRRAPEEVPDSETDHPADFVIKALGFDPEDLPSLFNEAALSVTRWGTLKINQKTFETSLPGVFATGDIVRGASLVVWAIRDGRDAAASIMKHLEAKAVREQPTFAM